MKTTIIYDKSGHIWNVTYGDSMLPQGLNSFQTDLPDNAQLTGVEIAEDGTVTPKYESMPASDWLQIQKAIDDAKQEALAQVSSLTSRLDEVAPEEKEPETLDEWKDAKKEEIGQNCSDTIYNGVDVALTDGTVEHFSLTDHDQLNLFGKQTQLEAGVEQLESHSDGQPCKYYSAANMRLIIKAAMQHVSYHTTYCNAVNMWIAGCGSVEQVQKICYGADVPEQYQSDVLKAYIASMKESAGDKNAQVAE